MVTNQFPRRVLRIILAVIATLLVAYCVALLVQNWHSPKAFEYAKALAAYIGLFACILFLGMRLLGR